MSALSKHSIHILAAGFAGLLLLASPCEAGKPPAGKAGSPLVAPGPAPDAAILFLGNLQGNIDPCT